jgi:hypothetical protein
MPAHDSDSDVICDSGFLERRQKAADYKARMEALEALGEADLERSRRHVRRAMSDSLHGWRRCELTQCVSVRHNAWPRADELRAIDDYYAALQHHRLQMAEEAEQARE